VAVFRTNYWATKRSAQHYHRSGAGGVIKGKFYVAGGFDDHGNPVAALDRYDLGERGTALRAYGYNPATKTWNAKASPTWGAGFAGTRWWRVGQLGSDGAHGTDSNSGALDAATALTSKSRSAPRERP
jgi:hypothetical protein